MMRARHARRAPARAPHTCVHVWMDALIPPYPQLRSCSRNRIIAAAARGQAVRAEEEEVRGRRKKASHDEKMDDAARAEGADAKPR